MKGFYFSPRNVFALYQYNFYSYRRVLKICLFEDNRNIFNRSPVFNFNTVHSLLKKKESFEIKSKDSTDEKRLRGKAPVVNEVPSIHENKKIMNRTKSLTLRPGITQHDLQLKIKQIQKFISKSLPVAVKVENPKNVENGFELVFSQIEKSVNEHQIPAKIAKTGPVINIYPIKTDSKSNKNIQEEKISGTSGINADSEGKS